MLAAPDSRFISDPKGLSFLGPLLRKLLARNLGMPVYESAIRIFLPRPDMQRVERRQAKAIRVFEVAHKEQTLNRSKEIASAPGRFAKPVLICVVVIGFAFFPSTEEIANSRRKATVVLCIMGSALCLLISRYWTGAPCSPQAYMGRKRWGADPSNAFTMRRRHCGLVSRYPFAIVLRPIKISPPEPNNSLIWMAPATVLPYLIKCFANASIVVGPWNRSVPELPK
jgi:hypothetical protein